MDLNLSLTDLSPNSVKRILDFVSREVENAKLKAKPIESGQNDVMISRIHNSPGTIGHSILEWAKGYKKPFTIEDVLIAFPSGSRQTLYTYLSNFTKANMLKRVSQGVYQLSD